MDAIDSVFDPLREFAKDSVRLVKRCHKPDRKEFTKVAFRTAIGFVVMGFVGFFVKLIFIPINNIIVGSANDGKYASFSLDNSPHSSATGYSPLMNRIQEK
ncbi:hypothetical protein GOBAR_AA38407 [Gossypium barbadense]|uniref:Protein transport protein Sec61 subunit gamma n=1 Tax=Gossypium barbadense TaxID=3634 RepID=A0A2P5VU10_GOSBA|nr:hypothetical protein GOBAR_AA38407 [Gossypium barbadense]